MKKFCEIEGCETGRRAIFARAMQSQEGTKLSFELYDLKNDPSETTDVVRYGLRMQLL